MGRRGGEGGAFGGHRHRRQRLPRAGQRPDCCYRGRLTPAFSAAAGQIRADVTRPPTVSRIVAAVRLAAHHGASLIVLPELAASGCCFLDEQEAWAAAESLDGPMVSTLRQLSATLPVTIVGGFALHEDGKLFNASVAVEDGEVLGVYRKVHLWGRETEQFRPGDRLPPVVQTRCGTIAMMVCYDLEFPELTRIAAQSGAEIVTVPANWPVTNHPADQPAIEVAKAQAAAAYYGVYVVVADRCGDERGTRWVGGSCIIAPSGYLLAGPATPPGEPARAGLLMADMDLAASKDKTLGRYNHRLLDRRPEFYRGDSSPD
ncbi:MAG: nitrilase-related carbon-nitrogen hydrolase [Lapillicoccus sp.]